MSERFKRRRYITGAERVATPVLPRRANRLCSLPMGRRAFKLLRELEKQKLPSEPGDLVENTGYDFALPRSVVHYANIPQLGTSLLPERSG